MTEDTAKWGIVSTIKAPLEEIERFAAHHLELGASRLYIYLDEDNETAFKSLKKHPKIRVFRTHGDHWRSKSRPEKHQVRQTANARHAYRRKAGDVGWLAHIDVDEFLWPQRPIAAQLAELPETCMVARVRPIEALSAQGQDLPEGVTCFKAMTNDRKARQRESEAIYPTYGTHLNGGFLSHVAGKLFVRTGHADVAFRIHNALFGDEMNPGQQELPEIELCHLHATDYAHWLAHYRYRLAQGVYRADLKPSRAGGLTMHALLTTIEESEGEAGLRAFFEEVCTATPALRARLDAHGLLRCYALDLDSKRMRHFPV